MNDPLCQRFEIYSKDNKQSTSIFGEYDPTSIMNYCYRYFLTHVGLDFEVKRKFNIFTSKSYGENVKFETIKHLTDETIITRKNLKKNTQEISIKIGLSKNDVHSLKCLYLNNDIDYEKLCTFQED